MAGFFDRMKERFTQYAAGTTDLSGLSEDQQKLLRRQAIGRLGASLYRDGDFGAAMAQQEEINAQRIKDDAARRLQEERARILGGVMGQSPLTPDQQRLVGPSLQAPAMLRAPGTAGAPAPYGQPEAQAAPTQQPQPSAVPTDLRARFQQGVIQLQQLGDTEGAKLLLEQAKQFAPLEEWFAPTEYTDPATGETRLGQFSKFGNQRLTEIQAAAPDTIQSLRAMQKDPTLFAAEAALREAGATRMPAQPFESAFSKTLGAEQAKQFQGYATQAVAAQETLQQLSDLRTLLSKAQTGATPEVLASIGRYFGTENASTLEAVRAAAMPFILSRMQQLGGGDSNEELRAIRDALPGFGISPRANDIILGSLERQAQRAIGNYQQAVQFIQVPGNRGLTGFLPTVRLPSQFGAEPPPQAGGSAFNNIPGFEPPPTRR